jgi:hypothetical protein
VNVVKAGQMKADVMRIEKIVNRKVSKGQIAARITVESRSAGID